MFPNLTQNFLGKELVSWLVDNGPKQSIKSREDAIQFGNDLLKEGHLFHINKELDVQDDGTLYTFNEENTVIH